MDCNYIYVDTLNNQNNYGYLYLNSENKRLKKKGIVLTELRKKEVNKIYNDDMYNRYIHRLTFKKPFRLFDLHDKEMEKVSFYSNKLEEFYKQNDINKVSGYKIIYPRHKYKLLVNLADILEDKIVFDYLSVDSEELNNPEIMRLNDDELYLLEAWMSGEQFEGEIEVFKKQLLERFMKNPFRRKDQGPITLYRGLHFNDQADYDDFISVCESPKGLGGKSDQMSSWTPNICVAETFANLGNGEWGVILKHTFKPNDILIDTRLLGTDQLLELFSSIQEEIIIKPGNYPCNIVMKIEDSISLDADGKPVKYVSL